MTGADEPGGQGWSTGEPPSSQPAADSRPPEAGKAKGKGSFLAELPVLVLIAFVLAILMKTFLVQAFFIPSSSMEPTLLINDRVLVNKLSYVFREPRRGEVVVFSERGLNPAMEDDTGLIEGAVESIRTGLGLVPPTEKDFIKRIIGLPGETIEMREGVVLVDGVAIAESPTTEGGYLSARDLADFGPVTVPDGEFFMMGDNRPSSADSRSSLGTIPRDDLIGRAFVVIWPVGRATGLPIQSYPGVPAEAEPPAEAAAAPLAVAS
jgi:signal peptidase I